MKIKNLSSKVVYIVCITIGVLFVLYMGMLLTMSVKVRHFNIEMQVLANETKSGKVTFEDESLMIDHNQVEELCLAPGLLKRKAYIIKPAAKESFQCNLLQRTESVNITYSKVADDVVYISYEKDGKESGFYFMSNTVYDEMKDVVGL